MYLSSGSVSVPLNGRLTPHVFRHNSTRPTVEPSREGGKSPCAGCLSPVKPSAVPCFLSRNVTQGVKCHRDRERDADLSHGEFFCVQTYLLLGAIEHFNGWVLRSTTPVFASSTLICEGTSVRDNMHWMPPETITNVPKAVVKDHEIDATPP